MKKLDFTANTEQKRWISLTGYRALLILQCLMHSERTVGELINILKGNSITSKSTSKDTVRVALNTLKNAGCKFSRPSKANHYKYKLISHPFKLQLSEKEFKVFSNLRNKFAQDLKYEDIFVLNEVYKKIISLTFNQEQIEITENSKPLIGVKEEILRKLLNPKIIGKKVQIIYNSPKFGEEELDIVPQKLSYEEEKLHLWCYSFKYKQTSLLSIERIIKINYIDISYNVETSVMYDVIYTLTGDSVKTFEQKEFEEILEKTEDTIKILAHVENEFYFIQRLFLFGCDFRIISPDFFKEKLINKIKLIQQGYEE